MENEQIGQIQVPVAVLGEADPVSEVNGLPVLESEVFTGEPARTVCGALRVIPVPVFFFAARFNGLG